MYEYEKKFKAILLIADTLNDLEIARLIKKLKKRIQKDD
tara:strand:+ start:429 stop:545 length:117 start_codon:yes stop_codon:yes gene_type:complete